MRFIAAVLFCFLVGCISIQPPDYGVVIEGVSISAPASGRITFSKASLRRYADGSEAVYAEIEGRLLGSTLTPSLGETVREFTETKIAVMVVAADGTVLERGEAEMVRGRSRSTDYITAEIRYRPQKPIVAGSTVALEPLWQE